MTDPRAMLQAHLQMARYELVMAEQKVQSLEGILIASQQLGGQQQQQQQQQQFAGSSQDPAAHFQAQRAAMVQALALQQRQQELQAQQQFAAAPNHEVQVVPAPAVPEKKKRKRKVMLDKDGNILKKAASGYTMYMTETMVSLLECFVD